MRDFHYQVHGAHLLQGGLSFLLLLVITGLLTYLVVLVKRDAGRTRTAAPPAPTNPPPAAPGLLTPDEVIRMRYARGEITRDEFETMRRDLG